MRLVVAAVVTLLVAAPALAARPSTPADEDAQTILNMLDYVAVDYAGAVRDGTVLDKGEYEEQVEFVTQARSMLDRLPPRPITPALVSQADALREIVLSRRPATEVAGLAQRLRWALIAAYDVEVSPGRAPDLRAAAALYAQQCAACHGVEGRGDGPAGKSLDPPPASFHDRERLAQRSVYGLYSTITLGVSRTGMTSYRSLSESERWALAFHVASLGVPPAEIAHGADLWKQRAGRTLFPDLASVATLTERDVRTRGGDDLVSVLAYLRSRPEAITAAEEPLARSARLLRESLAAYRRGDAPTAQRLALASYLEGFELVEPALDAVDAGLRASVEAEMLRYRSLLRTGGGADAVESQGRVVSGLLDQAHDRLRTGSLGATAGLTSAFLILLREGLEAILVVAAIVALLVKAGRRDALPYIHAGWVSALVLGGVTWALASSVISLSGATRETTEGVTALAAAAVLLYVGFWMHGKAYSARWRAFIEARLGGAVSSRTKWALALVSFLAVYREAFEMVLFSQVLWLEAGADGRAGVGAGFVAAAITLVGLAWLAVRGGLRLPLGVFFGGTSALLALLAVVFAGKGVAALQEAGLLPVSPVGAPALPMVGLYPNAQGLMLQAALVLIIAGGFFHTHRSVRRAS
jgi:high-affinity iron transporter